MIGSGGGGVRGTWRGRSLRSCRSRFWEREPYVPKTEIAEADDEGQRYQSEKNKPGMGFGFVLVVEQIVKALIGSIRGRPEVEDSTRIGRSRTRRLVPRSALGDRRRDLGAGLGQRLAAHSAEAVILGIFIATMGAAHDYVFPPSRPTRSVGAQRWSPCQFAFAPHFFRRFAARHDSIKLDGCVEPDGRGLYWNMVPLGLECSR